jgi:long-subunit fatty acid transport protein
MKKIILTALTIWTFTIASAQKREAGAIEVAPFIGYSSFSLNGDNVGGLQSINSTNLGVNGDYFFNDRWSLRTGISMQKMGARVPGSELALNYILIPINANWHFGSTRKWNLNFGLSAGALTSANIDGNDAKSYYNSSQTGLSYGIGYKLEVSKDFSILIDSQGFVGLSNIYKDSPYKRMNAGSNINIGGVFHF